ncbi:sensor histidine kinase [Candidatus Electronema sp. PJ]|uniref:sensor histidine kinase n=1 Tax=Candidatus Electronema sp. PJ TaxID=3401572 RepID=UPI003AA96F62
MLHSIKGRLLLWIFVSVTVLFLGFGYALHLKLHYVVNDSLDKMLHANLQLVKGLVHTHDSVTIECETEEFMKGDYVLPDSGHYYKVFIDGKLKTASYSLVDNSFDLTPGTPLEHNPKINEWIYISDGPDGEPLRVIRHEYMFMGKLITLVVAEDMTASLQMIDRLANYFLIVMPVIIVLIGLTSLIIAEVSLRPLQKFSDALERISHKNLEARIAEKGLAQELRRLAGKFNSLLERLQQAFEAEKNLLGDAAHELKTPLAVIKAECDIALQKTRTEEEYAESLTSVREVANGMLDQINGLLTLARLDSGMLDASAFQPLSLNSCIADAVRLTETLAKKKNVVISTSLNDEITIQGDKDTLTEAILNLVENAVKYNHPGGFVSVELNSRGKQAEIVISDTGIGISEEDRERIFDRFYRSAAARGGAEGTGLGLSIAKAVMRTHNGEIKAEAQASGGSRFVLTLPLPEV